ncbi:MAG: PilZ domain-containing protein [Steroidobacteraceae bacterium]
MEHRWGNRMELHAPAVLQTPTGSIAHARVRNASISGAFVETLLQLPLLSRVQLRPDCETGEWLEACVVRVESDGAALEWLDPPLQAVSALLALRGAPPARAPAPVAGAVIAPHFRSWVGGAARRD